MGFKINWLVGSLVLFYAAPSLANETLDAFLNSEAWLNFKSVLINNDVDAINLADIDNYCRDRSASTPFESDKSILLRSCIEVVLKNTGSRSELLGGVSAPEKPNTKAPPPPPVDVFAAREEVVYVRLDSLPFNAHIETLEKIRLLEDQKKIVFKKFIVDLRGNTGGALIALDGASAIFLGEDKEILKVVGKNGRILNTIETSLESKTFPWKPVEIPKIKSDIKKAKVVVLIDRDTVSGGEALAMILKRNGALIMGETSKGLAEVFNVEMIGDIFLKIHVGTLYTANKETWSNVGVVPNIVIAEPRINPEFFGDFNLDTWLNLAAKRLE